MNLHFFSGLTIVHNFYKVQLDMLPNLLAAIFDIPRKLSHQQLTDNNIGNMKESI